jgi:imidazolonepropionase
MSLLIRNARILTLAGSELPRRGAEMRDLGIIPQGDVLIEAGRIAAVGPDINIPDIPDTINAAGRVLMPGFIDCHTHACWAGDRLAEWEMKLRGVPYLEILQAGGGIHSTVRAVRAASETQLAAGLSARLDAMLRGGTTTVEVKSGYGLSTEAELKMLFAIRQAARNWPGLVIPTALLGHAYEGNYEEFVGRTINETLPQLRSEFPGLTIDAFCEKGAWTVESCVRLFEEAGRRGHPFRVHADQFNSLGMLREALRLEARSIDHLEATTDEDITRLGQSRTYGVILPCTGFSTDGRYARGRQLVDAGVALALATNCNPGSAPTHSMPFAIALAVRHGGLTPAEAIVACTLNAAALLHRNDRGRIERGLRADLILLAHKDERQLAYEVGGNPVDVVICGGQRLL